MKYLFIIFISLIGCEKSPKTVDYSKIEFRGELAYLQKQENPFSGRAIEYYSEGKKKAEVNYRNGRLNGEYADWYPNGQMKRKGSFKDGKFDGLWIRYHKDGTERSRTTYNEGRGIETIFND
ncbi:MAG: hypothetical protein HN494_13100 [Opitutae bacterium]|jgi:antitoxin component YwqK of YwqJK toxin-antitoxin module|nr:hypothetical protein [Opitutae bacterium]MBT4666887.1 hypothetical protein [Opitutae bacterium]MBT5908984.1 hypothetical protein [Opitutae bacterium]MBT6852110.1 hypothetical protein [Opitutae bacterium]MBT7742162.1 hypothetical protein [Opitutae bacterium]